MSKHMLWFSITMIVLLICGIVIYVLPETASAPESTKIAATTIEHEQPATELSTASVQPTEVRFGNIHVGGVALQGLTETEAREKLATELAQTPADIRLIYQSETYLISAEAIDLHIDLEVILAEAAQQQADTQNSITVVPSYDAEALQAELATLEAAIRIEPSVEYSPTLAAFVLHPGQTLDAAMLETSIQTALTSFPDVEPISVPTKPLTTNVRPSPAQLAAALEQRESAWADGLIAVAVTDLASGERYGYRQDTVYSGMSILKIGILLQAYIQQASFSPEEYLWIDLMTRMSDNFAANHLLEIAGEGDGLEGVQRMNATFRNVLGLEYTRMTAPFESIEYLTEFAGLEFPYPEPEGPEPRTAADPYIRATPSEVNRLVEAIVTCADGNGPLLEIEPSQLSAERCQEILYIMSRNRDINKLVSGVPQTAFVAHKSGWIEDTRADAGYIRTQHGVEYIASIWIWSPTGWIETYDSDPLLSDMSRIVYTSFEPIVLTN